MSKHLLHIKSDVLLDDGTPKLPTSDQIEYGELAINYAAGNESIFLKNNNDEIVKINSDNGGSSSGSYIKLTQAAYDALTSYQDTLYIIVD